MKTKKIATIAICLALSIIATYISFPILPSAPYLKVDFSDVTIFLIALLYGWKEMVLSLALKGIFLYLKTPDIVGVSANLLTALLFISTFYVVYKQLFRLNRVVLASSCAIIVTTFFMCLTNYFIFLPAYHIKAGLDIIVLTSTLPFNLIKGVLVSIVIMVLLKQRYILRLIQSK